MSFKDCILGKIADGSLSKDKGEKVLKEHEDLAKQFFMAGRSEEAAELAANRIIEREQKAIDQKHRNLRQHALKSKEIIHDEFNAKLAEHLKNYDERILAEKNPEKRAKLKEKRQKEIGVFAGKYSADLFQKTAFRSENISAQAMRLMNDAASTLQKNFFETKRDYETFKQGLALALGKLSDDPAARVVADVIKKTFDHLHAGYRAAGGVIGKIDNYFPQIHRKEAIRKVSAEEWVDYTIKRLNPDEMIDFRTGGPLSEARLREILIKEHESIVTGGRSDLIELHNRGETPKGHASDIDTRHAKSRFMVFKDADAFLEYNARFGVGDEGLIEAFLGSVNAMSRDIALLEKMGPRPNAIARGLDRLMDTHGTATIRRNSVNAQYRILASRLESGDVDGAAWRLFSGLQNLLRSSTLGSAVLSAMTDLPMIASASRVNGLSATRATKHFLAALSPADTQTKQLARKAGFLADVINGSVLGDARHAGEHWNEGFTGWLSGLNIKFQGLGHWTKAIKDGIALEGMSTIGEHLHAKRAWADLDGDFKESLGRFGFNEADWSDLSKADVMNLEDAKFLLTSDLRVNQKLDARRAKDLADKLDDWTMSLRQMASNESLLATRAITTGAFLGEGAGGAATSSRAIMSSLTMFKSFPITVVMTHLMPAIQRIAKDPTNIRKYDHLALTTLATTLVAGLVVMPLKDIAKGKTPRDDDNNMAKYWMAAFLQGGGLGLFGDFALGDYSRFGRNPITEAMGPIPGLFEDIYTATKGNLDRVAIEGEAANPGRDIFRIVKRNIPLGSLWYSRLAMERFLLDNLERLVDPAFDRRMRKNERRLTKETGQRFWWAAGGEAEPMKIVSGE